MAYVERFTAAVIASGDCIQSTLVACWQQLYMQAIQIKTPIASRECTYKKIKMALPKGHCHTAHNPLVYIKRRNMFTQQMSSTALQQHLQQFVASVLKLFCWYKAAYCSRVWVPLGLIEIDTQSQR